MSEPTRTPPPAATVADIPAEQRRRHSRAAHRQPVRVKMSDQTGRVVDEGWARIADLSPSGVRLEGLRLYRRTEITDAHRFELVIVFEDGCQYIQTRSAPRWADEEGDLGLEFDQVDLFTS